MLSCSVLLSKAKRYVNTLTFALPIFIYSNFENSIFLFGRLKRFGADNRLFVVLLDKENPEISWELKRDFALVFQKIDNFFDKETVSKDDEIVFTFGKRTYTAVTKALIITK